VVVVDFECLEVLFDRLNLRLTFRIKKRYCAPSTVSLHLLGNDINVDRSVFMVSDENLHLQG